MNQFIPLVIGIFSLSIGAVLGYYARQSIAKRDWKTIESNIQSRIQKVNEEGEKILTQAKEKAAQVLEEVSER